MAASDEKLQFEASAYLQTLIGRELIRTQEAAVVELVKNSYDSGAHNVTVTISTPTTKRLASIKITDDGSGMDLQRIKRIFMVAGYSERDQELDRGRVPTGEKGIGRFASDRLGTQLLVETKTAGTAKGIVVDINWRLFDDRKKKFNEIRVPYYERALSEMSTAHSGTVLTITGLRDRWEDKTIQRLRQVLSELLNPYETPKNFTITLVVEGSEKFSGPITAQRIEKADFDLRFHVDEDGMLERRMRTHDEKPVVSTVEMPDAKVLAGLTGRFLYFTKRPHKEGVHGRPPGVFIYRDGFHVEPFGSHKADWLGIGEKRAKRAGHAHIVPSRLFGFLSISRTKHATLQDTTSREALIDNDQARELVHLLGSEVVDFLEEKIRMVIDAPRWAENRAKAELALQKARFQALNVMSSGVAHELRQPLQAIRADAENIDFRLQQLLINDPIIKAAQQSIDKSIERISQRIQLISELTGNKLDITERANLSQLIQEECALLKPRALDERVALTVTVPKTHMAIVSEPLVRMVVKNMVDNAIHALAKVTDGRERKITVRLTGERKRHDITVEDNGPGIPKEIQDKLLRTFATQTTGGMGVGLYICELLLQSHHGAISFRTTSNQGTVFTATFVDQEVTTATSSTDR
jgi:signal transduction histidine kinase